MSWQALPFREMSCVVRRVYSPVHRRLYVDRIERIVLVSIWYCIILLYTHSVLCLAHEFARNYFFFMRTSYTIQTYTVG